MTEQFLEDYFKNLATVSVDLANTDEATSFYRMKDQFDLDEFDNAVRSMSKDKCMLLEIGEGSICEYDSQNDMPKIGLHVLCKSTEEFSDINAARDLAKTILLKIVARMRLDCKGQHERVDQMDGPLRAQRVTFDTKIKFANMSAIDGNWYGKTFYFYFRSPLNLAYDTNDWTG